MKKWLKKAKDYIKVARKIILLAKDVLGLIAVLWLLAKLVM